jgi:hypothetical protein
VGKKTDDQKPKLKRPRPNLKRPKPKRPIKELRSKFKDRFLFGQFGHYLIVIEWTKYTEVYMRAVIPNNHVMHVICGC